MTTIAAAAEIQSSSPKLIAPRWHTLLLVALFLGITVGGALFQRQARAQPETLPQHPQVFPST